MDTLHIDTLTISQTTRQIILSGQLATNSVSDLEETINRMFKDGTKHLIVDMKRIDYICSNAVALLFHYTAEGEKNGKRIGIISPPEKIRMVFDLCGGDKSFNLGESIEELTESTGVGAV